MWPFPAEELYNHFLLLQIRSCANRAGTSLDFLITLLPNMKSSHDEYFQRCMNICPIFHYSLCCLPPTTATLLNIIICLSLLSSAPFPSSYLFSSALLLILSLFSSSARSSDFPHSLLTLIFSPDCDLFLHPHCVVHGTIVGFGVEGTNPVCFLI